MALTQVSPGILDSNAQYYGFKNRIINGGMVIDQRNVGASVTPTDGQYLIDRWFARQTTASKFSAQQNAGSVTPPTGFINYLGCTSLSAYSVLASDIFGIGQNIEGLNISDFAWGTASATPITISFWVRSSLTGTFGGSLRNNAVNRSYPFNYTISAANTWEQKTVFIAGDTSGTWLTDNGVGLRLLFSLGAGSTVSGTAGSWSGSNFLSATGATSVVGTNGATFYITGVQLEKGSTATSFDVRPYGTELALCQRYYQKSYDQATAPGTSVTGTFNGLTWSNGVSDAGTSQVIPFTIVLPQSMRSTVSMSYWDAAGNASKFSIFTGGAFTRTDNQGGLGATYLSANSVIAGYGTPGAGTSYAFAYALSAEL